jgi:hypothetical protein
MLSVACPYPAPRERAVASSDALSRIHREHVHGTASGRFELLRALAVRNQRGALAVSAARLRMWAAQAGLSLAQEPPVDTGALELMSAAELEALLSTEELRLLHAGLASAPTPEAAY